MPAFKLANYFVPQALAVRGFFNLSDAAAPKSTPDGARVFSVALNGLSVLPGLNLARTYGPLRAVEYRFRLHTGEQEGIHVSFLPIQRRPSIRSLRLFF